MTRVNEDLDSAVRDPSETVVEKDAVLPLLPPVVLEALRLDLSVA